MNRKRFCLSALFLTTIICYGQEKTETDIINLTKITFLNPGISYEHRIGKLQSLYFQAFMNTSAGVSYSSSFGWNSDIYFDPALTAQYRYYYNAKKRESKGKRTERNNLNYVAGISEITFSKSRVSTEHFNELNRRAITNIGIAWGIQRNYNSRFSLDLNLGLGYLFTKASKPDNQGQRTSIHFSQFTGLGQLNLGFWLNKRN